MAFPPPPPSPFPWNQINNPDYYSFVVIVAAITVMLVVSNIIAFACCSPCNFLRDLAGPIRRRRRAIADGRHPSEMIPTSEYRKEHSFDADCSVCLTEFREGEEVRQLPGCKHSYHPPCIDTWLHSHASCPVCRGKVAGLPPPQRCPRAPRRPPLFTESHPGFGHMVVVV